MLERGAIYGDTIHCGGCDSEYTREFVKRRWEEERDRFEGDVEEAFDQLSGLAREGDYFHETLYRLMAHIDPPERARTSYATVLQTVANIVDPGHDETWWSEYRLSEARRRELTEGVESVEGALDWEIRRGDRIAELEQVVNELQGDLAAWSRHDREQLEAHEERLADLEQFRKELPDRFLDWFVENFGPEPWDRLEQGQGRPNIDPEQVSDVRDFLTLEVFGHGPLEGVRFRVFLLAFVQCVLLDVRGETLDGQRTARSHLIDALDDLTSYLRESRHGPQSATEYLNPEEADDGEE